VAKRKAKAACPRQVPTVVVADATEIGTSPGVLIVRTGPLTKTPAVLTLPAETVDSFVSTLQKAACAAEEEYWGLLPAFRAEAANEDSAELARAKETWLLSQPWQQEMRRVLARGAIVCSSWTTPGTSPSSQLRPTRPPLTCSSSTRCNSTGWPQCSGRPPTGHGIARWPPQPTQCSGSPRRTAKWSSLPWPRHPVVLPTQQQAETVITGLRTQFLRRTPLLKEH
jgi:hypothetical protein